MCFGPFAGSSGDANNATRASSQPPPLPTSNPSIPTNPAAVAANNPPNNTGLGINKSTSPLGKGQMPELPTPSAGAMKAKPAPATKEGGTPEGSDKDPAGGRKIRIPKAEMEKQRDKDKRTRI